MLFAVGRDILKRIYYFRDLKGLNSRVVEKAKLYNCDFKKSLDP